MSSYYARWTRAIAWYRWVTRFATEWGAIDIDPCAGPFAQSFVAAALPSTIAAATIAAAAYPTVARVATLTRTTAAAATRATTHATSRATTFTRP